MIARADSPIDSVLVKHVDGVGDDWFSTSVSILDVIHRYRSPRPQGIPDRSDEGSLKFLATIYRSVKASQPVRLCLPAFPFKSPNNLHKVLGQRPDKGEEIALAHLNGLCLAIKDIYQPGAKLTIISDGLVYNDLLGVADQTVWNYGQELRQLAKEKGFENIEFSRLKDLLHMQVDHELSEMAYVAAASTFRMALLNRYGVPGWDTGDKIPKDDNMRTTYCGYIKFLETDLANQYPIQGERTKSQFKKGAEKIANTMLVRGAAFAKAIRENFPNHVRLSIHPSTGEDKISINVLPSESDNATPWHCAVAIKLDGTVLSAHRNIFEGMDDYELVHDEKGRPSYFREKSDLYDWGEAKITVEPLYPCGLCIRPANGPKSLSIKDINSPKLRALAESNSPVILRGFTQTRNRDMFVDKAHELGTPLPWKFGLVLEVKDQGSDTRGLNNVLSQEWMPFHYDGLFKTEKRVDENGKESVVSVPPRFQLFTGVTPSPKDTGYTLFSPSRLVFKYLPPSIPLSYLRSLTWTVATESFDRTVIKGLPLVVSHPTTHQPCLAYHEPWPQEKTRFQPTEVTIDNGDQAVCDVLDSLLHDRRVCYWHSWEQGDVLVSDNVALMHTRSDFVSGTDRELWRIHFD